MTMVQSTSYTMKQLYAFLKQEGLHQQAEKVLDLYEKEITGTFAVGFAGHFSAGKSTLINFLAGTDVLPSSPIPTSANIVRLKKGDEKAIAYNDEKQPIAVEESRDIERLKEMCKDNRQISSLSIYKSDATFPEDVEFIDTPGVDSTDDMDRTITEGSLHVIDHLYYVVDYNHVQSEVNSSFLQEMETKQLPFTLVINQMDKHREEEVPFEEFCASVLEWLDSYGLEPDGIFYTTMHPSFSASWEGNEQLRNHLRRKMETRVRQDHLASLFDEFSEAFRMKYDIEAYEEQLKTYEGSPVEEAENKIQSVQHTYEEKKIRLEDLYKRRVRGFLKNAYITPAVLRDDAASYLEAMQPNFKKGFLFTREKTKEEREFRTKTFRDHLQQTLEKNLEWPLRDRLRELTEESSLTSEELEEEIRHFHLDVEEQVLEDAIARGAGVTGEYVLRYMEDLSKRILQLYQQETERIYRKMKLQLEEQETREHSLVEEGTQEDVKQKQEIEAELQQQIEKWKEKEKQLRDVYNDTGISYDEEVIEQGLSRRETIDESATLDIETDQRMEKAESVEIRESEDYNLDHTRTRADRLLPLIKDYEFLNTFYESITEKKERLDNQQFTVALFGAFSAGKSSFINALLGDDYLPTSPNPTTASINRVMPPDASHPHETATVTFYSEEEMLAAFSFLEASSLEDVMDKDASQLETRKKTMLEAFQSGYSSMGNLLDSQQQVSREEFADYVSVESYSIFVKMIDFYVDSSYTRQGITFVDTPGADSVNDRHTDVSFNYIKEADAILFLTYYNHPFTKADARFLRQLGRVKDSFAVDKMFFIINASDLAQSEEDLQSVRTYIRSQLTYYGVRRPRLHTVSSLLARKGRREESDLPPFEKEFETFIHEELQSMVYQSIEQDMKESLTFTEELIDYAKADETEKQARMKKWQEEERKISEVLQAEKTNVDATVIVQKLRKQFHYMKERQQLQLTDNFKEEVNPGTIKGNKFEVKEQLDSAIKRLIQGYEDELTNECQALTLRMEHFVAASVKERKNKVTEQVKQITDSKPFGADDPRTDLETPSFRVTFPAYTELTGNIGNYTNTKQLFEANKKEQLKEEISEELPAMFDQALGSVEQTFESYYSNGYEQEIVKEMQTLQEKLSHYYANLRENSTTSLSTPQLVELKKRMEDII
ncbi:dynamin family protein [Salimicrobium halophilum]|uniref:Small GTP-binding protein domain-containing protein n=1 Tax=Salimicrobium halophilum TaxID=86666 RepID=A0A1G8Q3V0_9BACI|nr:dynamin family protein [Salimicrobium halophilum]SDI99393.1 small GTP-binding protein domain-containing protein [Salimicrobium halophilum]